MPLAGVGMPLAGVARTLRTVVFPGLVSVASRSPSLTNARRTDLTDTPVSSEIVSAEAEHPPSPSRHAT